MNLKQTLKSFYTYLLVIALFAALALVAILAPAQAEQAPAQVGHSVAQTELAPAAAAQAPAFERVMNITGCYRPAPLKPASGSGSGTWGSVNGVYKYHDYNWWEEVVLGKRDGWYWYPNGNC